MRALCFRVLGRVVRKPMRWDGSVLRWEEITTGQRMYLGRILAEERLPLVNRESKQVVPKNTFYSKYGKRVLDVVISSVSMLIVLPVNLILGVATFFDVGRPIFFKQTRIGKNGEPFVIVKFRNMTNECNEKGELLPASKRVTNFGRLMRSTSLDELWNFWSVLKGDMSIIGPRPLVGEYVDRYSDRHAMRLSVRPGLECPPMSTAEGIRTWQDQFENDVWYVENMSFRTDVTMFFNLFRFAFDAKNVKARVVSDKGTFMGYGEDGVAINLEQVPEELFQKAKSLDL